MSQIEIPAEVTGPEAPAATATPAQEGQERTYGDGAFSSVEELEQAYAALKAAPANAPAASPENTSDSTQSDQPANARSEADKTLESKGLNMTSFEQEWANTGALSEDSYKALEKAGIPKGMVDQYIAGQSALMSSFVGEVQQLAGGADAYTEVTRWATEHMNPQEVAAYNDIMNKGDKEAIKLAVSGLVSRYHQTEGRNPQLVGGSASAGGRATDAFESTAQVVAAMKDPRYGKDPAYTRGVEARMGRSKLFG